MGKCKNCGHEIWEIYHSKEWLHKHSNSTYCSGDDKKIQNCDCTNPEPIQEVSGNSSQD